MLCIKQGLNVLFSCSTVATCVSLFSQTLRDLVFSQILKDLVFSQMLRDLMFSQMSRDLHGWLQDQSLRLLLNPKLREISFLHRPLRLVECPIAVLVGQRRTRDEFDHSEVILLVFVRVIFFLGRQRTSFCTNLTISVIRNSSIS